MEHKAEARKTSQKEEAKNHQLLDSVIMDPTK
jgi:hypothetical protein